MLSKFSLLVVATLAVAAHAKLAADDLVEVNALVATAVTATEAKATAEVAALTTKWEAKVAETVAGVDRCASFPHTHTHTHTAAAPPPARPTHPHHRRVPSGLDAPARKPARC